MVKSKQIYSPQNFVDALTGYCYIFQCDDTIKEIHDLLKKHKVETRCNPLWDYPLNEIEHIVENKIPVVLVDVSGFNEKVEWVQEYRWFEVPEDFQEEME